MTEALFLADFDGRPPRVGDSWTLTGPEARHAATVRRIGPGERVVIGDGDGFAVAGTVTAAGKDTLTIEVDEHRRRPPAAHRWVAVQAIAKGDRSELAVEMLTEQGIDEVIAWQASRSIARWSAEKAPKALARWRNTARESTKQSRRLRIPEVTGPMTTKQLLPRVAAADLALIWHETATAPLAELPLPEQGEVLFITGPEGGISDEELELLISAGARPVLLSDGVLRTSTAGVVGLAQLQVLTTR
ncbi:16S rRNA (uracil(1498)-N(3))-methyltransferase [Enemella sp. A6]|uniref:16S rRNA (uracil(1498)-N(3))-methyltransferase n=1 Tax=Enemella sp. A6 TaxID=3440152 RepID=UPI003EBBAA14